MTQAQAREYFSSGAKAYAGRQRGWPWSVVRRREEAAVRELLGDVRDRRVLDIATGAGYYAALATSEGAKVVALDFSHEMLRASPTPGVQRVQADMNRLPFATGSVDAIVLAGGLEFVDDPRPALAEARRVCVASGRIVILYPPTSLVGRAYRLFHRSHAVKVRLYGTAEMTSFAEQAGLSVGQARFPHAFAVVMSLSPR